MAMFSSENSVRRLFAEHDLTILHIRRNGHWQVKASRNGGPPQHFTVPISPSDYRSLKNLNANLKRGFSREFGGPRGFDDDQRHRLAVVCGIA